jgi:hypothetical protein
MSVCPIALNPTEAPKLWPMSISLLRERGLGLTVFSRTVRNSTSDPRPISSLVLYPRPLPAPPEPRYRSAVSFRRRPPAAGGGPT